MKKKTLSKSEIKDLNQALVDVIGSEPLSKKDTVVLVEDEVIYYIVNGNIDFVLKDGKIIPTLKNLLRDNFLKKMTVDMGAVKFVASGADIMRPGVVAIDDGILKDSVVSVIDVNNKKPLAVGLALLSSEEFKVTASGKCVKNLHFIGDSIWKIEK